MQAAQKRSTAMLIRELLAEGPATASEVAIEPGMDIHLASAHLASLRKNGKITSRHFRPGMGHRAEVNLYDLVRLS